MGCRESRKLGQRIKGSNGWISCYLIEESKMKPLRRGYKLGTALSCVALSCLQASTTDNWLSPDDRASLLSYDVETLHFVHRDRDSIPLDPS
ncbi:hypothetical protein EJB05_42278, partial [Eragrostis curvula]